MNNLWKGIAIAGIWIGVALIIWAISFYAVYAKHPDGNDVTWIIILAAILTWVIKNRNE